MGEARKSCDRQACYFGPPLWIIRCFDPIYSASVLGVSRKGGSPSDRASSRHYNRIVANEAKVAVLKVCYQKHDKEVPLIRRLTTT